MFEEMFRGYLYDGLSQAFNVYCGLKVINATLNLNFITKLTIE